MTLKLYTPGHGVFMDSLIMYGLASSLPVDVKYRVEGVAGSFEVSIEDLELSQLAEYLSYAVKEKKERVVDYISRRLLLVQKSSVKRLNECLESLEDPGKAAQNLEAYLLPSHAKDEGRWSRGGRQHAWLPFYPHAGKYFTGEYQFEARNYGVCSTCITLAALGFLEAVLPILSPPPDFSVHVVLLTFEGSLDGELIGDMLEYIHSPEFVQGTLERWWLREAARLLPLNTFTYILLTAFTGDFLRSLSRSKALWTAISTTFNIVRGVAQIRGYEEISIDGYLSSLARLVQVDEDLKAGVDPLEKLRITTERLVREGEPVAVEALYKFLNTRSPSDLYTAVRQVVKALGESFGKSFCEELVWLARPP